MNNKISYSLSLESYINSLKNDYTFSDYQIKINNKSYEELNFESKKLLKEITDFYSTEDIKENFDNIILNFKNLFTKFQNYFTNLKNKVDSLLVEAKSKNNIYKNFKNELFKSLDTTIFERKLNEKIIYEIEAFIRMCYSFSANFHHESTWNKFSESFNKISNDDTYSRNQKTSEIYDKENHVLTMFFNDYKKYMLVASDYTTETDVHNAINNIIDNIFYSEKKEREMTIGEYFFNPEKGKTPFLYELLSEKWLQKIEDLKKEMEIFLNEYEKAYKEKKFENFDFYYGNITEKNKANKQKVKAEKDKILNYVKHIALNIMVYPEILDYFFSTFFTVRKKIEYYLLQGITGKIFPKKPKDIIFPHAKYFDVKKPQYIRLWNIPSKMNAIKDEKPLILFSTKNEYCDLYRNSLRSVQTKDSNYFTLLYITRNEIVKNKEKGFGLALKNFCDKIKEMEPTDSYSDLIQSVFIVLFQLPLTEEMIPYLDFSYIDYEIEKGKSGDELFVFRASFFITTWGHRLRDEDILFHSSNSPGQKVLTAYSRSKSLVYSLYPEPTFFFGLNNIMTKDGDIIDKDKSYNYYLKKIVSRAPELVDYTTFWGGRNDASTYCIYTVQNLPKDTILLTDSQFYCNSNKPDPYWSRPIYPFRTLGIKTVEVEDITNIIWAAKDLGI